MEFDCYYEYYQCDFCFLAVHFWAPTFKWGITIANILDSSKPPEQVSYAQQTGLLVHEYYLIKTDSYLFKNSTIPTSVLQNLYLTFIYLNRFSFFLQVKSDLFTFHRQFIFEIDLFRCHIVISIYGRTSSCPFVLLSSLNHDFVRGWLYNS